MTINLRSVDLNLLTAFEALLAEGSVTRAARRLGISQPALSDALGRLRHLFNDQLFIREHSGMSPTRKAQAVAEPIAAALASIRLALEGGGFEAATTDRTFRLGLGDYGEAIILPQLLPRFRSAAPRADLRSIAITPDSALGLLDRGEVDLAIEVFPAALPDRYWKLALLDEHALCLSNDAVEISDTTYFSLPHVVRSSIGAVGGSIVDTALRTSGRSRRVTANVANVLALPLLLKDSNLIATQPSRVAHLLAKGSLLRVQEPPIDLPGWTVVLVGGTRAAHDPAASWFKDMIVGICAEL